MKSFKRNRKNRNRTNPNPNTASPINPNPNTTSPINPRPNNPNPENSENSTSWADRKYPAIFLIILAILLSSMAQILIQQHLKSQIEKSEQINLAKGYLFDVESVNITISSYIEQFNDTSSPDYQKAQKYITPLYPSWGLYHSNRQDISRFPTNLSNNMYYFYNRILIAENARLEFNNYETLHPISPNAPLNQQTQNINDTKMKLFKAYFEIITDLYNYTIPNLKKDLNDMLNSQ